MPRVSTRLDADVVIVGAGAAGLAAGIFARRAAPHLRVIVVDGAHKPGAKILVSGGSRCNVTNAVVTDRDYNGGRSTIVRRILRAFPVEATVAFFRDLGVTLHEEAHGKLFPDSHRARDVLDALLQGLASAGAELRPGHRVRTVTRRESGTGFDVVTARGPISCGRVVLATGGLSLPKTGSDGHGYALARAFGHTIVPTTPALVPLCLDQDASAAWRGNLSGVSHPVHLRVVSDAQRPTHVDGAMLWTHFGVSGPAVLDASRHWLRHQIEGRTASLRANLLSDTFETTEATWLSHALAHPRQQVGTTLAALVPAAVADAVLACVHVSRDRTLADLPREDRRLLLHTLTDWPLPITGSRGYSYAEVTAGGIDLREIDPATMASRLAGGLHFVGEILDVDGRLGGFNFQWAWSTAYVCGTSMAGE